MQELSAARKRSAINPKIPFNTCTSKECTYFYPCLFLKALEPISSEAKLTPPRSVGYRSLHNASTAGGLAPQPALLGDKHNACTSHGMHTYGIHTLSIPLIVSAGSNCFKDLLVKLVHTRHLCEAERPPPCFCKVFPHPTRSPPHHQNRVGWIHAGLVRFDWSAPVTPVAAATAAHRHAAELGRHLQTNADAGTDR